MSTQRVIIRAAEGTCCHGVIVPDVGHGETKMADLLLHKDRAERAPLRRERVINPPAGGDVRW